MNNKEIIGRSAVKDIAARYGAADDFNLLIDQIPTVDAVEVVRCKECKAFGESPWGHFHKGWCKIHGRHRDPNYYCASGVRKDAEVE